MRYAVRDEIVTEDITEGLLKAKHETKTKRALPPVERGLLSQAYLNCCVTS